VKQDERRSSEQDKVIRQRRKQRDRRFLHEDKDFRLVFLQVPR
jgi:hypothetical protein